MTIKWPPSDMSDKVLEHYYQLAKINYLELRKERTRRSKIRNALLSQEKAKANGNKLGRKKVRNDKEIRRLRKKGLSLRAIAAAIGLSTTAVQRGLKP